MHGPGHHSPAQLPGEVADQGAPHAAPAHVPDAKTGARETAVALNPQVLG